MKAFSLIYLYCSYLVYMPCISATRKEVFEDITVLANASVQLPCKPASDQKENSIPIIVLWYKGKSPEPFYSYDLRQKGADRHWSDETLFGSRATFEVKHHPLSLSVKPVRPEDEAIYRCRVDFQSGPSKTFSIRLNIVDLPGSPVIIDESGSIVEEYAGPYKEKDVAILTCRSIGGHPLPRVVWLRDNDVIDTTFDIYSNGHVQNVLRLEKLNRNHIDSTYRCRVTNNNITQPSHISTIINMTLAPLSISLKRLNGSQEFVQNGREEHLECVSVGSRPKPTVTWWRDGTIIKDPATKESSTKNETKSVLRIRPKPSQTGEIITCRVQNPLLPGSVLEESYKLNVHYVPQITLRMGLGLNPSAIKEGSDVFMDCNVTANPKASRIIWTHENKVIEQNVTAGVIFSNQTLVIQKISKERTGDYKCTAINSEGNGVSIPIYLKVLYSPICKSGSENELQVRKHAKINIECLVDAQPPTVSFRWQLNSTSGLHDLRIKDHISTNGTKSVLRFAPSNEGDFGLVICSARNVIGNTVTHCMYNVTVAKPPDVLESCAIRNQSSHSVFVSCKDLLTELPAAFTMEVHTSDNLALVTTVRNTTPAFLASGLDPGTAYVLHIVSKTPMGISKPIKLRAFTVKTAEKRMGISDHNSQNKDQAATNWITILIATVSAILMTLVIIFVVALKTFSKKRRLLTTSSSDSCKCSSGTPDNSSQQLQSLKGDHCTDTLTTHVHSSLISDDTNPDLIPASNDCDYRLEELKVPISQESEVGGPGGSTMGPPCSNSRSFGGQYSYNVGGNSSGRKHTMQSHQQQQQPQQHNPHHTIAPPLYCYNTHCKKSQPPQPQQQQQYQQSSYLQCLIQPGEKESSRGVDNKCIGEIYSPESFCYDVDPNLSNVPSFPPPEGFRSLGDHQPQQPGEDETGV